RGRPRVTARLPAAGHHSPPEAGGTSSASSIRAASGESRLRPSAPRQGNGSIGRTPASTKPNGPLNQGSALTATQSMIVATPTIAPRGSVAIGGSSASAGSGKRPEAKLWSNANEA